MAVVEIGSGSVQESARRILLAMQGSGPNRLRTELLRAEKISQGEGLSSFTAEQAELLGAVVESIRANEILSHDAEISLLGHLAKRGRTFPGEARDRS